MKDGFCTGYVSFVTPAAFHDIGLAVMLVCYVHPQASECGEWFSTLLAGVNVFVGIDVVGVVMIFEVMSV